MSLYIGMVGFLKFDVRTVIILCVSLQIVKRNLKREPEQKDMKDKENAPEQKKTKQTAKKNDKVNFLMPHE